MKKLIILLSCLVLIFGCKKDDPTPDPRPGAKGSYAYIGKFYSTDSGDLEYLGVNSDQTGNFNVTVDANDPSSFTIADSVETQRIFKCISAKAISGGFYFEIPQQDITDSSNKTVSVSGYNYAYLGDNGPYQGIYETKTAFMTFYFQYQVAGKTFVGEYTCAQR